MKSGCFHSDRCPSSVLEHLGQGHYNEHLGEQKIRGRDLSGSKILMCWVAGIQLLLNETMGGVTKALVFSLRPSAAVRF